MAPNREVGRLEGEVASGAHSVASLPDGAVFYSDDGDRNRVAAEDYVEHCHRSGKPATTLEATPCGKWLEGQKLYEAATSPLSRSEADEVWATASAKYASEASGNCRCFIINAPAHRVFRRYEFARLLNNDRVTNLNNIPRETLKTIYDRDPNAGFSALEQADRALRATSTSPVAVPTVTSSASTVVAAGGSSSGGGAVACRRQGFPTCTFARW